MLILNLWSSVYDSLSRNGILSYFDTAITRDTLDAFGGSGVGGSLVKPSPSSLALALGLLDSDAGKTLHVGDTLTDLVASQKVLSLNRLHPENLLTVGVTWGYEGREKLEAGVVSSDGSRFQFDYLVDKPSELVSIVADLRGS